MTNPYDVMAPIYDRTNAELDYGRWADFIEAQFIRYAAVKPDLVLDLAAGTGSIILGHLSGENNTPELAESVSAGAMEREGIRPGKDVSLQVALRDRPGAVYTLRRDDG